MSAPQPRHLAALQNSKHAFLAILPADDFLVVLRVPQQLQAELPKQVVGAGNYKQKQL